MPKYKEEDSGVKGKVRTLVVEMIKNGVHEISMLDFREFAVDEGTKLNYVSQVLVDLCNYRVLKFVRKELYGKHYINIYEPNPEYSVGDPIGTRRFGEGKCLLQEIWR